MYSVFFEDEVINIEFDFGVYMGSKEVKFY